MKKKSLLNPPSNPPLNSNVTFENQIILYTIFFLKKTTKLTNKTLGMTIRIIHCVLPLLLILITLFFPYCYAVFSIPLFVFIIVLYYIFNGCILSKIEYKLDKIDFTIFDPILKIFEIEVNNKNRKIYSIYFMLLYLFILFLILYLRRYK